MPLSVHTAIIASGQQDALAELLAGYGFHAWSLASRLDGDEDLTLYSDGDALPPLVTTALAERGIATRHSASGSAEELVAGYLPDRPCELCPGVWIDPGCTLVDEPDRLVLRLPPSLAFGDGHHPSTRMAAGMLMRLPLAGATILDLGCGTGVLGLLALRRGAARGDFTDVDPAALDATRRTLAAHGVSGRVFAADLLTGVTGPYQLVIANLYADLVLLTLADPRLDAVLPHGDLVLSGIHARHRDAVRHALATAGFTLVSEAEEAWWCALHARR